jgi:hypothetical protein
MLNLDDYFWSLVEHPTDWINDRNYETPEAMDIQLLNAHLEGLAGRPDDSRSRSIASKTAAGWPPSPSSWSEARFFCWIASTGCTRPSPRASRPPRSSGLYIETQNVLREGDGSSGRLTNFTDVRLLRRMFRDARHRNHSPLLTDPPLALRARRGALQHHPLAGPGRPRRSTAGSRSTCRRSSPSSAGPGGCICPAPEELQPYAGFLDARIRYERVKRSLLIQSRASLANRPAVMTSSGRHGHTGVYWRQHY